MNVTSWTNRFIRWGFYGLAFFVPLILTPWNYELFEFNKMMLTYVCAAVILVSWLVKSIATKSLTLRRTPLDIPLFIFLVSQFVSSIFSMDPHVSWNGYYSRFNGGMWSLLTYVFLYYAFIHVTYENEKEKTTKYGFISLFTGKFVLTIVASSILVCIYGILQRLGIDKTLWVQDVQNRVFSTLGQPNWLAAYLSALIPLPIMYLLTTVDGPKTKNFALKICSSLGLTILYFTTLLFTRSRSGLVASLLAIAASFVYSFLTATKKGKNLAATALVAFFIVSIAIWQAPNVPILDTYLNPAFLQKKLQSTSSTAQQQKEEKTAPSSETLLTNGGTESGTIRKYVWQAALSAWQSTIKTWLIGTGTETFAFAFYQFKPQPHNLTSEWDFLYNKAHNEYLNYLATTGIIGLGTYLVLLVFCLMPLVFFSVSRITKKETDQPKRLENALGMALAIGWTTILVTNFFGFSVVIVQLFLFLFPAIYISFISDQTEKKSFFSISPSPIIINFRLITAAQKVLFIVAAIFGLWIFSSLFLRWFADVRFASGYRQARGGSAQAALAGFEEAILINSDEPLYHDEYASALANVAVSALEAKDATVASSFASKAEAESRIALTISPNNVNFWKTRTRVFYTLSPYEPRFNSEAIKALEQARRLSPQDPKILYNLAILYGRIPDNDKAIQTLQATIASKPNYRDSYYALYLFYLELKKPKEAVNAIQEYLTKVDPNDSQFKELLKMP